MSETYKSIVANPGAVLDLGSTVQSAYLAMRRAFAVARFESPQTDARLLLQGILHHTATDIILGEGIPLSADEAALLESATRRRLNCEPVSRILGVRGFYGRDFLIGPDVLDPRPDTETVVDAVLELAHASAVAPEDLRIADIGVGSGAILLSLMAELPKAKGVGTDFSAAAIKIARCNAERLGVMSRVELVQTDLLSGVDGPFHIIVSNPPYIPTGEITCLSKDVRDFDPLLALDGGGNGMEIYHKLASKISELNFNGVVAVEVGAGQADAVKALLVSALGGVQKAEGRLWKDLGGHIRCVTVSRHS